MLTLLVSLSFGADAPEFLLADVGVRLNLSKSTWHMTRWSDYDFTAKSNDESMHLQVWSTPVQVELAGAVDAWGPVFVTKADELGAKNAAARKGRMVQTGGRPVALTDVGFDFGSGGGGLVLGASVALANQTLHVAVAGPSARSGALNAQRTEILETLEVFKLPRPVQWGAEIVGPGVSTKLPEDWRPPLEAENAAVAERASAVGLDDLDGCATALRPRAGSAPDVMVICAGNGVLGVVDEFSFEGVEPLVRKLSWGPVDVQPAGPVALGDRMAFVYSPELGQVSLAVGVVPAMKGVTRTWVIGAKGDGTLGAALTQALLASRWEGPHPVTFGETVSYYVSYRPTHPAVLGSACCGVLALGGVIGGAFFAMRPKKRTRHDED